MNKNWMDEEMSIGRIFIAALMVMLVFVAIVFATSSAFAEERTIKVIGFNFKEANVIFEDEDNYNWACPFGKHSWTIHEEYTLFIEEEECFVCENTNEGLIIKEQAWPCSFFYEA